MHGLILKSKISGATAGCYFKPLNGLKTISE